MTYFLAVGDVLTVLALGASNASRRMLLIRCGTRCLYSGTSSVHKCQGQSLFKKWALLFLSTVTVTQIPVHRRDRGCASEVAKPSQLNDRFRGGSSSASSVVDITVSFLPEMAGHVCQTGYTITGLVSAATPWEALS